MQEPGNELYTGGDMSRDGKQELNPELQELGHSEQDKLAV